MHFNIKSQRISQTPNGNISEKDQAAIQYYSSSYYEYSPENAIMTGKPQIEIVSDTSNSESNPFGPEYDLISDS